MHKNIIIAACAIAAVSGAAFGQAAVTIDVAEVNGAPVASGAGSVNDVRVIAGDTILLNVGIDFGGAAVDANGGTFLVDSIADLGTASFVGTLGPVEQAGTEANQVVGDNGLGVNAGQVDIFGFQANGADVDLVQFELVIDATAAGSFAYASVSGLPVMGTPVGPELFTGNQVINEGAPSGVDSDTLLVSCVAADLAAPFGLLDGADVNAFISAFGSGGDLADLNGDGLVDGADVNSFISQFGGGCP